MNEKYVNTGLDDQKRASIHIYNKFWTSIYQGHQKKLKVIKYLMTRNLKLENNFLLHKNDQRIFCYEENAHHLFSFPLKRTIDTIREPWDFLPSIIFFKHEN